MQRLRHRRLVLVAVAVVFGAIALVPVRGGNAGRSSVARALAREFAMLRDEGLVDTAATASDGELASALEQLEELIAASSPAQPPSPFASLAREAHPDPARIAEVRADLEGWRSVLDGFAALPDVLWESEGEATTVDTGRPSGKLLHTRDAAYLLTAAAWSAAREERGGEEAGTWLARALATTRVMPTSSWSAGVQLVTTHQVIAMTDALLAEGIVDRERLLAPLRAEVERFDPARREARYWGAVVLDVMQARRTGARAEPTLVDQVDYLGWGLSRLFGADRDIPRTLFEDHDPRIDVHVMETAAARLRGAPWPTRVRGTTLDRGRRLLTALETADSRLRTLTGAAPPR